jgi:O-acetylhomoserine/O-acetylserine sulfhydrylase-like pyridoxal-dependent enzyme
MIEMAIRPETIRLSIGIEHIDDIDQALAKIDDISSFQRAGEAYFSTSGYGGAATIESSDACTFAVSNTES